MSESVSTLRYSCVVYIKIREYVGSCLVQVSLRKAVISLDHNFLTFQMIRNKYTAKNKNKTPHMFTSEGYCIL